MRIWITKLHGGTLILDCMQPSDPIGKLKIKICDKEGIPPECQRLTCAGEELADDVTLMNFKNSDGDVAIKVELKNPHSGCDKDTQNKRNGGSDPPTDRTARPGLPELHSACLSKDTSWVSDLLRAKADIHAVTNESKTPLMLSRSREVVVMILEAVQSAAESESADAKVAVRDYRLCGPRG